MNKIKAITFARLRNVDVVSFFTEVATNAQDIHIKDVDDQLAEYKENLRKFTEYTTSVSVANIKKETSLLDAKRMNAYRIFRNMVKSYCNYQDEAKSNLCNNIWNYLKKPGKFSNADQNRLTGIIESAIENVHDVVSSEQHAPAYEGSAIQVSFEALCNAEAEFMNALKARTTERNNRALASNKGLRDACVDSFFTLVYIIHTTFLVKKDVQCGEFINKLNILINERVSLYKSRSNRRVNKNKKEDDTNEVKVDNDPAMAS